MNYRTTFLVILNFSFVVNYAFNSERPSSFSKEEEKESEILKKINQEIAFFPKEMLF